MYLILFKVRFLVVQDGLTTKLFSSVCQDSRLIYTRDSLYLEGGIKVSVDHVTSQQ